MVIGVGTGSAAEDLVKVVRTRRTVRLFKDVKVPKELIVRILDTARWAPSGGNAQDWRFVVVTDEKLLRAMRMFSPGWLSNAPVAIVICSDRVWAYEKGGVLGRDVMYLVNAGIAIQTIALLAHAMGLATNIIMSFSPEAIKKLLDIPEGWDVVAIVAMGYPKEIPEAPPRLPLDKLVTWR